MGEDESVTANPTVLVVQHDLDSPLAALAAAARRARRAHGHLARALAARAAGGIVRRPDRARRHRQPGRHGRRRAARARARGHRRRARPRPAGARHLPRRPVDRPGARRPRRAHAGRARSAGWRSSSTRPPQSDALLAGAPRAARRQRVAQLRVQPARRRRACSPAARPASRPSAWDRRRGACSSTSRSRARCSRSGARRRPPSSSSSGCRPSAMLGSDEQRTPSRCASRRASPIASHARCSPPRSRRRVLRPHLRSSARGDGAHHVPARLLRRLRRAGGARGRAHQARARRSGSSRRPRQALPQVLDRLQRRVHRSRAAADDAAAPGRAEGRGALRAGGLARGDLGHRRASARDRRRARRGEHPQRALHGHVRADRHAPSRSASSTASAPPRWSRTPSATTRDTSRSATSTARARRASTPRPRRRRSASSSGARTPRRARRTPHDHWLREARGAGGRDRSHPHPHGCCGRHLPPAPPGQRRGARLRAGARDPPGRPRRRVLRARLRARLRRARAAARAVHARLGRAADRRSGQPHRARRARLRARAVAALDGPGPAAPAARRQRHARRSRCCRR